MCRSEVLFQMTGHCFPERPTRWAAGLFHQAETLGSGTSPFLSRRTKVHLPQGVNQHMRPGAAIGWSRRAIGAIESSIDEQC